MLNRSKSTELFDPGAGRGFFEEIRSIWTYRDFVLYSASCENERSHAGTVLGSIWLLLNPILRIAVYYGIFGLLLMTDRGVDNFIGFLTIGIFFYDLARKTVMQGAYSLSGNTGLINSFPFPRSLLPVSTTVSNVWAFGGPIVVTIGVLLLTGETPNLRWLASIPIAFGQMMVGLGLALMAARANYFVRDTANVIDFLFRVAFYASGTLFLVDRFTSNPTIIAIVEANPLYEYLALQRWALLGMPVTSTVVVGAIAWAIATPIIGFVWFRSASDRYGSIA